MFKCFNQFIIWYTYSALIFNEWIIAYRISNIGIPLLKTDLYSHDYSKYDGNLLDSESSNRNYISTKSVPVDLEDDKQSLYNKHPRFCFGNYKIFGVDISDEFNWRRGRLAKKLISYIDLLTKCNIRIEAFGNYSITYRGDSEEEDFEEAGSSSRGEGSAQNSINIGFSDKSLSNLKRIFGPENSDNNKDLIEHLKRQPIATYKVEDLISNIQIPNSSREDLLKFLEDTVLSEFTQPSIQCFTPISWEYFPSTRTVRIGMLLKDINNYLYLCFNLHPGTKSLVIDNGVLKIRLNRESTNVNDVGDKKSVRKYLPIAVVKVRHIMDDPMKKIVKHDPLNHKTKVISIHGSSRSRFNRMFNLMQMLSDNLQMAEPNKTLQKKQDRNVVVDTTSPVEFKIVSVRVNSQFKFLIPLVTYIDFRDGNTYLCNKTPIKAEPDRVWPLSNGTYAQYNMRFVPECYKNAGFFSNLDMEFNPEDVLKVLSSYLEFKKLIYENDLGVQKRTFSEFSRNDLTFEKDITSRVSESNGGEPINKGTNKGDKTDDFDVYYVNGSNKMIYKSCGGTILVNLLV